mmetsp:Transcript_26695/g.20022  ORF Transcript_26695/g.20022 Transcript_26695/m.20022 type:complete len:94 (+) Transcript_26695:55-336(+)
MGDRIEELSEEANLKIAHLENLLIDQREKARFQEEKSYEVMMMQEKILEKWKGEHKMTVDYYERANKTLKVESKNMKDKIVELKALIRIEKEN